MRRNTETVERRDRGPVYPLTIRLKPLGERHMVPQLGGTEPRPKMVHLPACTKI